MIKEIQDKLYQYVKAIVPSHTVVIGSLPSKEGVSISLTAGNPVNNYRQKQSNNRLVFAINSKFKKQADALKVLCDIHEALIKRGGYDSGDDWQITYIDTNTVPTYLGQEGNEWYLYGSSIVVSWYSSGKATDYPIN